MLRMSESFCVFTVLRILTEYVHYFIESKVLLVVKILGFFHLQYHRVGRSVYSSIQ